MRRYEARLERERKARKQAEALLENKSLELYQVNQALQATADGLELRVAERTAELHAALKAAQAANAAKSQFLALMSHEIRTPLNGVLGLTELLQSTPLDARQAHYVHSVLNAGNALLTLINDILDFSKIEAGEMQLERLRFDPAQLLCETLDLLELQARSKGIALVIERSALPSGRLYNDPTRLRQVWLNLIGNALKFTESGDVTVSLSTDGGRLACTVQDTGIGMSAQTIAHLFEPFRQADNSMARKYGGTGLGLVICKALVKKMGGDLQVGSVEGKGTRFYFDIPGFELLVSETAEAASSSRPDPAAELARQLDLSGLRILVVDDHPVNRLVARSQLKLLGCQQLHEADNGRRALEMLSETAYDLVLMDVQMPEMDGLETTRQLRQLPLPVQPKVIAMTANAFAEDRDACLGAGMDQFLSKPVNIDALRSILAATLKSDRPPPST